MSEESTKVQIGHKDGRVVLNFYGTSEVEPSYVAWSSAQAREVARQLVACADTVDAQARVPVNMADVYYPNKAARCSCASPDTCADSLSPTGRRCRRCSQAVA